MSNKVSPLLPGSENAAEAQAQKKQDRIKAMQGEYILFLTLKYAGLIADIPMDSGCTVTLVSGDYTDQARAR